MIVIPLISPLECERALRCNRLNRLKYGTVKTTVAVMRPTLVILTFQHFQHQLIIRIVGSRVFLLCNIVFFLQKFIGTKSQFD